jgi:hypothetical protein
MPPGFAWGHLPDKVPPIASQSAWRTIKECRHTVATLGLVEGVPVQVISEAIGHASDAIPYDGYSHVFPGLQGVSLNHLDRLFS